MRGRLQEREVHNDSYSSGKSILPLRYRQETERTILKNSVGQAAVSTSWSCFSWLLIGCCYDRHMALARRTAVGMGSASGGGELKQMGPANNEHTLAG